MAHPCILRAGILHVRQPRLCATTCTPINESVHLTHYPVQTILVAYHRGRMAPEGGATGGLMAAVGLGAEAADARIKKEGLRATVVACDNSAVNVTLAGEQGLT